ncbi:MAG: zinc ABC transporter ATP-binding protein ZnuC [Rhodospirillales bacterium]|jgi:zinc transport system ATP-binding protein|nr:zinc ABC transporter ATP-binding protein ZnuC [Rhodospirillales bacterium]MDP6883770.1 zinc ABC transporter ATP-binding protein ZnuC [Rhodospirillales bacterium]
MTERGEALVEVAGVDVQFGAKAVLSGVDLAVHAGEVVSLIGPNGAGKTTLVRVVLGLIAPDRGRVNLTATRIGYVPQHLYIDPTLPLTVRRFLALAGGSAESARDALAAVGAARLLDSPLHDLSGGETRRVLLARALLRDPQLLVLDEPVQGVDIGGQVELYEVIRRIRARHGCGVLMVSHDLHLVMAATDRVICLNRHVCCVGHPETVSRDPNYVTLFGARAAANLAVYHHHHDHRHDSSGEVVPLDEDGSRHG